MDFKLVSTYSILPRCFPILFLFSSYESNFYNTNLFANWKVLEENWEEIPEEILETYSPELSHSIDVCFRKVEGFVDINDSDYEWKKLELFETQILEDGK